MQKVKSLQQRTLLENWMWVTLQIDHKRRLNRGPVFNNNKRKKKKKDFFLQMASKMWFSIGHYIRKIKLPLTTKNDKN